MYGDIDENGRMTPLDGQQRLTTLFLLHVYAAKKENIDKTGNYRYLFDTIIALCDVLAIKAEIGIRTRKAYKNKNFEEIM